MGDSQPASQPEPPSWVPIEDINDGDFRRFIDYWTSLKGRRFAPSWQEFDLSALPPAMVPHIVVVDVIGPPTDIRVRFWGTAHVRRKGVEKTGKLITDNPTQRDEEAKQEYLWVVANRQPMASRSMVDLHEDQKRLPFEQRLVRLPLSSDGESVDHIVSLAYWELK
jgi:hypothetical protein